MKFARFPLFFSLALTLRPACAQSNVKPAPSTPIRYSRDVPKSVLKMMPRGAKSLFWGTFKPTKKGALMAIHLSTFGFNGVSTRLEMDVFRQKQKGFEHLNRVPITYASTLAASGGNSAAPAPFLVNANFFWITPNRRVPLLVLRYFVKSFAFSNGDEDGDALFISFTGSWRGKVTVQKLFFGGSNLQRTSFYLKHTPVGMLRIIRDDGSMNIGNDAQGNEIRALSIFRWNGRKFVVTSQTKSMLGPNDSDWKH